MGLMSDGEAKSSSALPMSAAAIGPSGWAWRPSALGKTSKMPKVMESILMANQAVVSASAWASGRAEARKAASSSSLPGLAVMVTSSPTVTTVSPVARRSFRDACTPIRDGVRGRRRNLARWSEFTRVCASVQRDWTAPHARAGDGVVCHEPRDQTDPDPPGILRIQRPPCRPASRSSSLEHSLLPDGRVLCRQRCFHAVGRVVVPLGRMAARSRRAR
jgi:hypothetical protein